MLPLFGLHHAGRLGSKTETKMVIPAETFTQPSGTIVGFSSLSFCEESIPRDCKTQSIIRVSVELNARPTNKKGGAMNRPHTGAKRSKGKSYFPALAALCLGLLWPT